MAKKKSYFEKLKDPRWQKKRLEILERDNFLCQLCNSNEKTLHVHHGYYTSRHDPWDYPNDSLMTLCEICHTKIEDLKHDIHLEIARIDPSCYEEIFKYLRDLRFDGNAHSEMDLSHLNNL